MDPATLRILDASLNRATEGLRVVEDFARFVLDDRNLTNLTKQLRHDLAEASGLIGEGRLSVRDTLNDVGAAISTPAESERQNARHVCLASLKRLQQSLRSLEEYGKLASSAFADQVEQLRYRCYTVEKALDTTIRSRERLAELRLCVLIDGGQDAQAFRRLVESLFKAGVGMLQLRDKRLSDRALLDRARTLVEAARDAQALAIINDRPDVAAAAQAHGVHLGQEDLPVRDARAVVGASALLGVSTHALPQAQQAVLDGADYLGAGPTFPSSTKAFEQFPGLDYLRQLSAEISLPIFAIGGIGPANLASVREVGVGRIAVSGAVAGAPDPAAAAAALLSALG